MSISSLGQSLRAVERQAVVAALGEFAEDVLGGQLDDTLAERIGTRVTFQSQEVRRQACDVRGGRRGT